MPLPGNLVKLSAARHCKLDQFRGKLRFARDIGVSTTWAISANRQSAFASCICRGLRHSGSRRRGLPTTITTAWARDVATLSRFRL